MINQPQPEVMEPIRFPLDPITITNPHALVAITVGAMLCEMSAEKYLIDLIDQHACELHEELRREMIQPRRALTPEEYAAYLARRQ